MQVACEVQEAGTLRVRECLAGNRGAFQRPAADASRSPALQCPGGARLAGRPVLGQQHGDHRGVQRRPSHPSVARHAGVIFQADRFSLKKNKVFLFFSVLFSFSVSRAVPKIEAAKYQKIH